MYYITHDNLSDEIKVRNSHFISLSYNVENSASVKKILSETHHRFPDANHICYAYRICNIQQLDLFYNPEIIEHLTDDGEPSGTAGRQILNVIKNKLLVNRLIIVVRYFGGIKLGIKGLIDAYSQSAQLVVKDIKLSKWILLKELTMKLNYKYHKPIETMISKYNGEITDSRFLDDITLYIKIPYKDLIEFKKNVSEKSKGTIQILDS